MIKVNPFTRPGKIRDRTTHIVLHWTDNPGQGACGVYSFFKWVEETYVSAHAVVGIWGEVVQILPYDEIAYHAGDREMNNSSIGIEICIPDATGRPTKDTEDSLVELVKYLRRDYDAEVIRHYDVTGKKCPKWFVDREDEWQRLLKRLDS